MTARDMTRRRLPALPQAGLMRIGRAQADRARFAEALGHLDLVVTVLGE